MEMKIFESEMFGAIRTMVDQEQHKVLFCGKDVAMALGYKEASRAITDHCKGVCEIHTPTSGGRQRMKYITEADIYRLVMASKLPYAVRFQDWVCEEVLPQIRQTGGYLPLHPEMSEKEWQDLVESIVRQNVEQRDSLIAEQQQRIDQQQHQLCEQRVQLRSQRRQLQQQQHQMQRQRPLVEFAHAVCTSDDCCTVAELAKMLRDNGYDIGQNRLFELLREWGYLGTTRHHWNIAKQRYVDRGYFKLKNSDAWHDRYGSGHYAVTTLVTGKGQEYFMRVFGIAMEATSDSGRLPASTRDEAKH